MKIGICYSENYDISFLRLESHHSFDTKKYSKAWTKISAKDKYFKCIVPKERVLFKDLELIHSRKYLKSLESICFLSSYRIAKILEIPLLTVVPPVLLIRFVLWPMKFAVTGTIESARYALKAQAAINLSGGYHHAGRDYGEGFCVYSDIGVAIKKLRESRDLAIDDKVAIIDLDAHQGNGLERIFYSDRSIKFFDAYNSEIYPGDKHAQERIDCKVPLLPRTAGDVYLSSIKELLPGFLNQNQNIKLAFYNAGTDVHEEDPLGNLGLTSQDILERDIFVTKTLTEAQIPWVMVLGGGYTKHSYSLIASSVEHIVMNWEKWRESDGQ